MPDFDSILAKIDSRGRRAPRVRLRELPDDPGAAPAEDARRQAGRYEIVGKLGRGAVGEVLRGRDVDLGRDVAMKILRSDHADNADLTRRFVEEAQVAGQLQHPGIVPVYELGLQGDRRPYFAMKLVKGRTLAELLRERAEPSSRQRHFLSVFAQVCQTIAYAHARGVIHRDLKPGNVMVGTFGEVQVVDWGFAKVLSRATEPRAPSADTVSTVRSTGEDAASVAGSVMGTPGYMPPEQALGRVDELDERSDVFALGSILTEILTGRPAFVGEPGEMLVLAARGQTDDALRRLDACGADPKLVGLARSCLSPRREDRPDAAEAAKVVTHHLAAVEERAQQSKLAAIEARRKAAEAQARAADAKAKSESARAAAEKEKAKAERARRQAEQAAAEAERAHRTRKQVRMLAGAAVAAVLAAGAGFWFVGKGRAERERATAAQVDRALQRARFSRGDRDWEEALHAARQAVDLGGGDRARAVLGAIEESAARAAEASRRRERERQFVARLEEIRLQRADRVDAERTHAAYRNAFRGFGIDVERLMPDHAKQMIRAIPEWRDVLGALDEWAWLRRDAKLTEIAMAADPDPLRNRLRDTRDAAALHALLADAVEREDDLPVETISLMALAFRATGDRPGAIRFLGAMWERHPDDLWITVRLAGLLAESGQPAEAARFHVAALALRPASVTIRNWLSESLCAAGEPNEALAVARSAVERAPKSAPARAQLAAALVWTGDRAAGERAYEEALALTDDEAAVHLAFGRALDGRADDGLRREALQRAVTVSATPTPLAYASLGDALHEAGETERAAEALREAVDLDPGAVCAHRGLGRTLRDLGRNEEALRAMRTCLELVPFDWRIHYDTAETLNALREYDEARTEAVKALELAPARAEPYLSLGHSWLGLGDLRRAARAFFKARPLGAPAYRGLGYALAATGDLEQAELATREALRLDPGHAAARADLGRLLARRGHFVSALRALRTAAPDDVLATLDVARILARDDDDAARAALARAREARPGLAPAALRILGCVRMSSDDVAGAVESLREALEGDLPARGAFSFEAVNHRALTWYRLGHAHLRLGEFGKAREAFARSHDLGRNGPHWTKPTALLIGECEDLRGDPKEAILRAKRRYYERAWAESVSLFEKAFADGERGARLIAARAAARAGRRDQALAWLREGLRTHAARLDDRNLNERRAARDTLLELFDLADFRPYRVDRRLLEIPQPERGEWRAFWAEVRLALRKPRPLG